MSTEIQSKIGELTENFIAELTAYIDEATQEKIMAIAGNLGGGNGTVLKIAKNATYGKFPAADSAPKKPRAKMPKQFCPVPGCKNVAAPIFGMVCSEHKGVEKAKIAKYRQARKYARDNDIKVDTVLKDWDKYKKKISA